MIKIKIKEKYKSLIAGTEFELPDFCVLTGKNGSGKSHLLEAISNKSNPQENTEMAEVLNQAQKMSNIRYIPFGGLNPQIHPDCNYHDLVNQTKMFWNFIKPIQDDFKKQKTPPANVLNWIFAQMERRKNFGGDPSYKKVLESILETTGKSFDELTEDIVLRNVNYADFSSGDMFTGQFSQIFEAYHARFEDNRYQLFKNQEYKENKIYLDEVNFEKKYGPKPWVLVNKILEEAHLPYRVNDPSSQSKEAAFHFFLRDPDKKIDIQANDLSTGEKVLMSLALAIYNTSEQSSRVELLLLDEPDAPLHPTFSKYLIDAIEHHIVRDAGVKVILTTHSPSTVAMADELTLYEMNGDTKTPQKIDQKSAIAKLSHGVPSLRVTMDKRRIVFVESNLDAEYYEKLFECCASLSSSPIQPFFYAPHNRNGSSCNDVEALIGKLVGCDNVFGIVDYDGKKEPSAQIKVLGSGQQKRYSIENYILDPLFVGLALLHDNFVPDAPISQYSSTLKAGPQTLQTLINWINTKLNFANNEQGTYTTISGDTFTMSSEWFTTRGHDLEEKIINTWPAFNNILRGRSGDAILKMHFLDTVIRDSPQWLASDFLDLFKSLE